MAHWLGWMAMAAGLPCWLMGFAIDLQVTAMLVELSASNAFPDSIQRTSEWVQDTYWFGPYLLWFGAALVVLGCVLGIIGLLVGKKSNGGGGTTEHADRFLNP